MPSEEISHYVTPDQLCIGLYIFIDLPWFNHSFSFNNFNQSLNNLSGSAGTQIELLQPTAADSAVGKWLEKNPLGGQHHICYEVPDIHVAKKWFVGQGKRVLGEPRIGAHGTLIFFVHPKDMGGQLTEIMEAPKGAH